MMNMLLGHWCRRRRYGVSFWAVHILGSAAIFLWGMRTASRSSVSIAIYRLLRKVLAK